MFKFIAFTVLFFNLNSALASHKPAELIDPEWQPCEGGALLSMTEEVSPYTQARLFQTMQPYAREVVSEEFGYSFNHGSPMDNFFIEDMLLKIGTKLASYMDHMQHEEGRQKWQPLVILEVGAGRGFFAQRFQGKFNQIFYQAKLKDHPPFVKYILNEREESLKELLKTKLESKPSDMLQFVISSNPVMNHLNSPNNKFTYDFVTMHRVSHFWNPEEFMTTFARLHQKMALGGKLYMTQDCFSLLEPSAMFMRDYIRASKGGDLCPGWFTSELCIYIGTFSRLCSQFKVTINPDKPLEENRAILRNLYNPPYDRLTILKLNLFEAVSLKKTLKALSFTPDDSLTCNFLSGFANARNTAVSAAATKSSESPDFSALIAQAKAENARKTFIFSDEKFEEMIPNYIEHLRFLRKRKF